MRSISDTISRLQQGRARRWPGEVQHPSRLSEMHSFGTNPGALRANAYVPDVLAPGAPLVVVLHGCTQNAAGYDRGAGWSQLADQEGFAVLFPEQQRSNNANLCFNWFVPDDIKRDCGEALSIRQMIEAIVNSHGLDRKRVFITGLSAGGAMTSVMLATYPEVFAGGASIAGLAYGSAKTIPEAFDRMRGHAGPSYVDLPALVQSASSHKGPWPSVSVWQGLADHTVVPANADSVVSQWRGVHRLKATPTRSEVIGGHERRVWTDAQGRDVIEQYSVVGMGHGTPLKTKGEDRLGTAGPFMLDVGISSTRSIARFWGILKSEPGDKAKDKLAATAPKAVPAPTSGSELRVGIDPGKHQPATRLMNNTAPSGMEGQPNGVKEVIERALRAAGLMR
ncbi:PHB depolymerase family esterase [Mesorhizobium sp. AR07]|uniref:extracellular catalytic domain type 1 short-chain-length polyhydroxyalkanoate depolymerase n=1 Tax=Mesorhizobium sp. AR07 TaxID=2865838 RepID=UPI00215F7761|nr:PHB depolymerase family esterase [Mesorhizobium sp. AR07]UVK46698.1 PHB depolymerase family esterase [Mesorhizobium sp. AR07]